MYTHVHIIWQIWNILLVKTYSRQLIAVPSVKTITWSHTGKCGSRYFPFNFSIADNIKWYYSLMHAYVVWTCPSMTDYDFHQLLSSYHLNYVTTTCEQENEIQGLLSASHHAYVTPGLISLSSSIYELMAGVRVLSSSDVACISRTVHRVSSKMSIFIFKTAVPQNH